LLEFNRDVPWWTLIFPAAGFLLITLWMVSGRAASMNFRGPERLLLLLPGVRSLVRDLQTYTAVRMMSLLIERGLPLREALVLAGGASGSGQLDRACRESAARVENGQSAVGTAGTAVSARNQLPPLLRVSLNQVEQNEERLVHRLRSVAEFYRNRMERNATWIRLTMPVLMFVMVGGGTVLAYGMMVFWPMSEIYRNLGN
jgi:type II secretory pathway component PulF